MAKKFTEKEFLKIVEECAEIEESIQKDLRNLKEENEYFFCEIIRKIQRLKHKRSQTFNKMVEEIKKGNEDGETA